MNWDAATIIRIIVAALLVALLVTILPSCKTVDCIPEVVYRDSIRTEYIHDSIYRYERDSIFIHQKALCISFKLFIEILIKQPDTHTSTDANADRHRCADSYVMVACHGSVCPGVVAATTASA